MTDLQAYIILITSFVLAFFAALVANAKGKALLIQFFRWAFTIKLCLAACQVILLPFASNKILYAIVFNEGHRVFSFFLSASFLAWLVIKYFIPQQGKQLSVLVAPHLNTFYKLFCLYMAAIFVLAGVSKMFFFNNSLPFFLDSGYSKQFLYFILAIETLCGIAVCFKKLAILASVILIIDMAGATFTHYHNHFTKGSPGPFGNSIPSLVLQPFLTTILVLSIKKMREAKQEKAISKIAVSAL